MGLGKNVGALVKDRNLSYGEVARALKLDEAQPIWSLVKRKSKKSKYASELASYFGVPLERLLADDFDVREAPPKAQGLPFALHIEELEAIKRLRAGLPEWRSYVLSLALHMTNHSHQELFLQVMRQNVPDEKVIAAYGLAPRDD